MSSLDELDPQNIKDPILIYQMGKVGSSSILASLKAERIPNSIFRIHQLSNKGFKRKIQWLCHHGATEVPERIEDLLFIMKLRKVIHAHGDQFGWKIISMTREPMGLEISSFFENIWIYANEVFDPDYIPKKEKILGFLHNYFSSEFDISSNYFCNWFDEELKSVFDIDVFSKPYDFSSGFSIFKQANISVLIIRLEDLNRSFKKAMSEFLNLGNIELIRDNASENKEYFPLYKDVLESLFLPINLCKKVFSSKYAQHFYRPDEIDHIIKKWSQGPKVCTPC